jgi:hypothetical protein
VIGDIANAQKQSQRTSRRAGACEYERAATPHIYVLGGVGHPLNGVVTPSLSSVYAFWEGRGLKREYR